MQDEYLIEQIDYFNTQKITDDCININIEKPLKQLSWVIRGDNNISSKLIRDVKLELNNKEEIIHWQIKPIELHIHSIGVNKDEDDEIELNGMSNINFHISTKLGKLLRVGGFENMMLKFI